MYQLMEKKVVKIFKKYFHLRYLRYWKNQDYYSVEENFAGPPDVNTNPNAWSFYKILSI